MKRRKYKVVKVVTPYNVWYEVEYRVLWFLWLTIDDVDGGPIHFSCEYEAIEFVRTHSDNTELRQPVMTFVN